MKVKCVVCRKKYEESDMLHRMVPRKEGMNVGDFVDSLLDQSILNKSKLVGLVCRSCVETNEK